MRKLDFEGKDIDSLFSRLEADVLRYLWSKGYGSTNILYKLFGEKHNVSHSSIAVTLGRLHEKGILKRKAERGKGGIRFVYHPKFTKEEFGNHLANKFVEFLRNSFGEACVANLKKKIK
ncbi:MAG: BlaI/MecI/CopY family transcriptional regulator [Candidatus Aenigmarchaeota archaeon]|nr:BlaI/MecI/CopY family transcriptional regulator [Candidatus Aenigmarchaeota archaeon]